MRRLVMVGLVLVIGCAAFAGGNPDVRIYIDFDPPNYVHHCTVEPYETIDAYICLDQLGEGVMNVSFDMDDPVTACPGVIAASGCYWLFPSGVIPPGSPWDYPDGITVISDWCLTEEPLLVGVITVFYIGMTGDSCCIEILDHGSYPRWVMDCPDPYEIDQYCILSHGSIGGAECPDGDCSGTPVQGGTWGTIKSLYR